MTRWFTLSLPDEALRKMPRAEYQAVQSYLRRVAREIAPEVEAEAALRMHNILVYGCSHPEARIDSSPELP